MKNDNITTGLAYMSGISAARVDELKQHSVYIQAAAYISANGRDGAMEIAESLRIPENATVSEWNSLDAQVLAISELNGDLRIRYFVQ